jgi:hypothetical protein
VAAPSVPEPPGGAWDDQGVHFGPQVSFGLFGDLGVGGRLSVGLSEGRGLGVLATADYFFGAGLMQPPDINLSSGGSTASIHSGGSGILLDGYVIYRFDAGQVKPYVGGGLSYYRYSTSTSTTSADPYYGTYEDGWANSGHDFTGSTIGGVRYGRFFADGRFRFGTFDAFTVTAGMSF